MRQVHDILPHGQESFSPKEVSHYIERRADSSTVTRWCQAGRIECEKVFGRWSITRKALSTLLVAFGIAGQMMAAGMNPCCSPTSVTRRAYSAATQNSEQRSALRSPNPMSARKEASSATTQFLERP